ncbi:hypothetical protein HPB51_001862 [Rhipicephalus microplus]|uniref:EGF-like domain-containing protein n=1 Tax=Rhipicephalus microplus TaxID=6941 RepID=A0A9J6EFK3_RHIMP|nr:hypothetical protein HPB51_001862 [Rhipicephalus microplus]
MLARTCQGSVTSTRSCGVTFLAPLQRLWRKVRVAARLYGCTYVQRYTPLTLVLLWDLACGASQVFLNGSTRLLSNDSQPVLSTVTSLTFRTCSNGTILRQSFGNDSISLAIHPNGPLELSWFVNGVKDSVMVQDHVMDPCFDHHCQHGGLCVLQQGVPKCNCTARYSGEHCEKDEGPLCDRDPWRKKPCVNGGVCVEDWRGNSTRCLCRGPWTGSACQEPAPNAQCDQPSKACRNGGSCVTGSVQSRTFCQCPPGYAGIYCEQHVGECQLGLCHHGGVCTEGSVGPLCNCQNTGFRGPLCDEDVNECAEESDSVCLNGGSCFNQPGSFECVCPPGFGGPHCEQAVGPCKDGSPCMHNSTCQEVDGGLSGNFNFTCLCSGVRSGRHCEVPRASCTHWSCTHDTQCRAQLWCGCLPGYREVCLGGTVDTVLGCRPNGRGFNLDHGSHISMKVK